MTTARHEIERHLQRITEALELIAQDERREVHVTIRVTTRKTTAASESNPRVVNEMRRTIRALLDDSRHFSHNFGGARRVRLQDVTDRVNAKLNLRLTSRALGSIARAHKLWVEYVGGNTYLCQNDALRKFLAAAPPRTPVK